MKKIIALLIGVAVFVTLTGTAFAAKPQTDANMTSTLVTSASDGSQWVLLQAERITQPGNSYWYVSFVKADGSPCYVEIGQKGTQTGTTWGPTSYTFAYYTDNVTGEEFSLQLGESYENVVGVFPAAFASSCEYGILRSGSKNTVLDPYVPLPWSTQ